ncbi:hypothetical protein [Paenisporosarcina cavernae]|uniref:Uncharacterized protein n=1 Tax=Paenisporosarcina cavernae TaxID=2320858 RepID=A0A385YSI9_9BACL|nr:hypothetical protein [Paenisporosarcina cavernae]AYC29471.1 hypothetical protein D3873_06080 [Paenisporosarcina cavernae]
MFRRFSYLVTVVILLSSCGTPQEGKVDVSEEKKSEVPAENESSNSTNEEDLVLQEQSIIAELSTFFLETGHSAHFEGSGNEFATLEQVTKWHSPDEVSVVENNGGTQILRTYRLTKKGIFLLQERGEFYDEYSPTKEELDTLPETKLILPYPLPSTTQVDTPLKSFEQAYMVEEIAEDGSINRSYYVKNYGLVKREFIMPNDGEEMIISSSLKSIK